MLQLLKATFVVALLHSCAGDGHGDDPRDGPCAVERCGGGMVCREIQGREPPYECIIPTQGGGDGSEDIVDVFDCREDDDCRNGGMCGDGRCMCQAGFGGAYCDMAVVDCRTSGCGGNGVCGYIEGVMPMEFACDCDDGYTGDMCSDEMSGLDMNTLGIALGVVAAVLVLLLLALLCYCFRDGCNGCEDCMGGSSKTIIVKEPEEPMTIANPVATEPMTIIVIPPEPPAPTLVVAKPVVTPAIAPTPVATVTPVPVSGPMLVPVAGPMAGPMAGSMAGPMAGPMLGPGPVGLPGPMAAPFPAPFPGPMPGPMPVPSLMPPRPGTPPFGGPPFPSPYASLPRMMPPVPPPPPPPHPPMPYAPPPQMLRPRSQPTLIGYQVEKTLERVPAGQGDYDEMPEYGSYGGRGGGGGGGRRGQTLMESLFRS